MFRYGLATVLAAALSWSAPGYAGPGGGGGHGGGHGGGGHGGGGGHSGGGYHAGGYHGGGYHYGGGGYHYGGGHYGGGHYGGYYNRGYGYGYGGAGIGLYGYSYPYYASSYSAYPYDLDPAGTYPYDGGPPTAYPQGYGDDPSLTADGGTAADGYRRFYPPLPAEATNTARVRVHLPEGATLWFDGTATQQSGAERVFETPALKAGKEYRYELKARWSEGGKPVEQTREVTVRAGRESVVDLTAGN